MLRSKLKQDIKEMEKGLTDIKLQLLEIQLEIHLKIHLDQLLIFLSN